MHNVHIWTVLRYHASNNKESVERTMIIAQSLFLVEILLICITCFPFFVAIDSAGLHEGLYR